MPEQTLQKLMDGNRRFVENKSMLDESTTRRIEVAKGQHPFATILGCVDSRVPPELIFDQGLGELFVIRTAGEVLDHAVLGSLEFGVAELNIPLIMVLGHKGCGAFKAASAILCHHEKAMADIQFLVKKLAPAIGTADEDENHLNQAIQEQIKYTVEKLKHTPILNRAIKREALKIAGGCYDLDTGVVDVIIQ
jgi:carbonic anhydrase